MVENQNPITELSAILADELGRVNALITERMHSPNAPRIPEITAHLINAGGKRIRPILTVASAKLCDYHGEDHIKLAATVEFIHTATLLHDDVVDHSEQRRGRPTANLLWDNPSSVLVGDYLFSRSFQLMVETGSLRVLDILANASAVIAEGEVMQLSIANHIDTSEAQYFQVIRGKTAALFAAACEVGGVISNAAEENVQALREYGMAIGLAFQIADDILDFIGEPQFGKTQGNDFSERKMTLPILRAMTNATAEENEFWQRTLAKGQQDPDDFQTALNLIKSSGALESTRQTALDYARTARDALSPFEESEIKSKLLALSDYVVERLI